MKNAVALNACLCVVVVVVVIYLAFPFFVDKNLEYVVYVQFTSSVTYVYRTLEGGLNCSICQSIQRNIQHSNYNAFFVYQIFK